MTVAYNDRDTPLAKHASNLGISGLQLSWDFTGLGSLAEGEAWLNVGATDPTLVKTGTISSVTRNSIVGRQPSAVSLYEYTSTTDYGLQVGTGDWQMAFVFSTGGTLPTNNNAVTAFEVRNAGGTVLARIGITEFASNGWYMDATNTLGLGGSSGAVYYGTNKTVIFWIRRRSGTVSTWTQLAESGSTLTRRNADASNSTAWDNASATRVRTLYNATASSTIDIAGHAALFWNVSFSDADTQSIGQDIWGLWANSAVSTSLTITSPTSGSNIPTTSTISGTYTGTAPVGVEVQHGAAAYVDLTSFTASGGNWSGSAALSAASSASLRARYNENTAIVSADITSITVQADGIAFTDNGHVTNAKANRMFQRDGSDQASVRITGTYTGGPPTSIQYRYDGGSWTTLVASPSGGTFDATVTLQGPAQGALEVRFSNATSVTASLANVGVGDVYIACGQSNHMGAAGSYAPASAPAGHPTWKAIKYGYDQTWSENVETSGNKFSYPPSAVFTAYSGTDSAGGSYFGELATLAMEAGVPIAVVACAKGSTSLSGNWGTGSTATSTLYGALLATCALIGNFKYFLWWQGEAEMAGTGSPSTWATDMDALIDAVTAAGYTQNWLLVNPSHAANGSTADGTTTRSQIASMSTNPDVVAVVDMDSPTQAYTSIHYSSPSEITTVAERIAAALGYTATTASRANRRALAGVF